VVGAVGIDFKADYVRQIQNDIKRTMLVSVVIAFIGLFVVIYLLSSYLTEPIMKLTKAAQLVGEGNYEQDFGSMTKDRMVDEIDVLASNFAIMVSKVYHREQNLRKQVEQLKIEIDESKRSKQVDEIVETDFFRELQSKADRMRVRRTRPDGEAAATDSTPPPEKS
jgi:signal transduction histidine kinase